MPFLFDQISGRLWQHQKPDDDWTCIGLGYSGNGRGLLNPLWQFVHNHGPIPAGHYTMSLAPQPEFKHLGPIVFKLTPDPSNAMGGRFAFYIHWDSAQHNMTASDGCIVFRDLSIFQELQSKIGAGDNQLEVVSQPPLASVPT